MYERHHWGSLPVSDTHDLPWVDDGSGHRRILAVLPPKPPAAVALPSFGASFPTIPRSEWKEVDYQYLNAPILDQDGHGSCVGHGSCTAFTYAWSIAGGSPRRFSPCFLYGLINRGVDMGAVVSDALEALKADGICLEQTVPEGHTIFKRQFPKDAFEEAKRFKAQESYRLGHFDEIATFVQLFGAVSFGTMVGQNFGNLDSEGIAPRPHGGGGGHCMCVMGLKKLSRGWCLKVQNSWGERWGQGGRCFLTEDFFGDPDAFGIVCPQEDPQETDLPPVAVA